MTYLDYSATTKVNKEVLKEVKKNLFTKITEEELEPYKKQIQKLLNTDLEVFITSGSSESNNWAIKGICKKNKKRTILTTKLEHSSINETLKYLEKQEFKIEYIPLHDGIIDINELDRLITNDVALITVASVNSETGALQPVNEIGKISKKHNIPFHCDMTQSIGKINIPPIMITIIIIHNVLGQDLFLYPIKYIFINFLYVGLSFLICSLISVELFVSIIIKILN